MSTNSWQTFLTSQGAHWDTLGADTPGTDTPGTDTLGASHFGDNEYPSLATDQTVLVDVSHWGCLSITGKDARKFLQGQVTCDLKVVNSKQFQRGVHCNVKGRALFSFYLIQINSDSDSNENTETDSFVLVMPASTLALAQQTLAKFIVFSKAELNLLTNIQLFGLVGGSIDAVSTKTFNASPPTSETITTPDSIQLVRIDGDRLLCLVPQNQAETYWKALAQHCQLGGHRYWTLAGIRAGLGEVELSTSGEFIPQFLNFHLTQGISFTKGCYIGQEVVARMEYRGTLKRHMRRAQVKVNTLPITGTPLFGSANQQSIGNIVSAVNIDADTIEILAVVTDQAFDHDDVFFNQQKMHKLQFLPLPYAITK